MEQTRQDHRLPFWRSLQAKYALTYLAVITAVLILLNSYPVLLSQTMVFRSKQNSLQSQASVIASALAGPDGLSQSGASLVMELLGETGLSRVLITDAEGAVVYDSSKASGAVGQYALIREVADALQRKDAFRSDYREGAFHSRAATPVVYRGMVIGAVYVDEYDADQGQLLTSIQLTLRNISLAVAGGSVLLSLLLSKALTARVEELLQAIGVVREGNYSHRVTLSGGDELSQMAEEFNALTLRLQETEEVRRRFVSDASHELKTPLASIRLLSDSILQSEQMPPETVRDFVGDIGEEAGRLQRITEKLLTLTKLDAEVPSTGAKQTDVGSVVRRIVHILEPLAQEGNITLRIRLEEELTVAIGGDDLYQVLFNLLENAVKYNRPGGWVELTARGQGTMGELTVSDNGVGIPDEDLERVFDRFYRVDKARSRAAGGTGLGLSIAQDIARQHGGAIVARRRPEGGTSFLLRLPLAGEEAGT